MRSKAKGQRNRKQAIRSKAKGSRSEEKANKFKAKDNRSKAQAIRSKAKRKEILGNTNQPFKIESKEKGNRF